MENKFPKRKQLRLEKYDYSSKGAYFVTICTKDRQPILSEITKNIYISSAVGDGALDVPQVSLTPIGIIVEKYLISSERIPGVRIDKYVIMPNHIHVIVFLNPDKYRTPELGTSRAPSPTNGMLPHVVSTFKRFCNKEIGQNIFQRAYIEHVIRDMDDYETRVKYIHENPMRWYYDELYSEN